MSKGASQAARVEQHDEAQMVLDPGRRSPQVTRFETMLRERIIGQDLAINAILDSFSKVVAGIRNPERPILTLLFLGPTGVGKTETVKSLAETIFGKRNAFTRINCQEFSSEFTVSKLFGSPPGYVGNDVEPLLSQESLEKHHKDAQKEERGIFAEGEGKVSRLFPSSRKHYLSIVLFDEIEKAHPKVWDAMLGLMEDGHLTLGNNETVDFTRSIIIFTTNVGAEAMGSALRKKGIGFNLEENIHQVNSDIKAKAIESAKEIFPYEFLNRFDDIICYKVLSDDDLRDILDLMLKDVYQRLMGADMPIIIHYTQPYLRLLLQEGTDPQFGARPLRRTIERRLVSPMARLIASGQVQAGDVVTVRVRNKEPLFVRDKRKKSKKGRVIVGPENNKD